MKSFRVSVAGLVILALLAARPAVPAQAKPRPSACCRIQAGAPVEVELVDAVGTRTQKSGDTFALRLAEPVVARGRIVLRAGTPGVGEVVEASRPGMGGKAAKLVLAARYLDTGKRHIPLRGLQLARAGRSNTTEAAAVGLTGIAFAPLGFIALAVKGGEVVFPAGTHASAQLATAMVLPSLGRAPPSTAQEAAAADDTSVQGSIDIPPPPAGKGQVVFFRRRSLLSTGQWFKVREGGVALGKLTNGAYFVQVTEPGTHTYTASFEPELKDHLKLEIDPGETYFVEGTVTKALLLGAADLSPSDREAFDTASKHLKPASSPTATADAAAGKEIGAGDSPPAPESETAPPK